MKNNLLKKVLCIALFFAFVLNFAACTNAGTNNGGGIVIAANDAAPPIFVVYAGDDVIVVDENGDEVMRGPNLHVIQNPGENGTIAQCFIEDRQYLLNGYDEYGYPSEIVYSAIYDINGNLLLPFEEGYYSEGYGNYLGHFSWYYSGGDPYMVNPFSGEIIENATVVFVHNSIAVIYNADYEFAFTTDFNGNIIESFPVSADMQLCGVMQYDDYFVTEYYFGDSNENRNYIIWDSQFNQISLAYSNSVMYSNGYFMCRNTPQGATDVFDPVLKEIIFTHSEGGTLTYFDGELYIYRVDYTDYLCKVEGGTILAQTNSHFEYDTFTSNALPSLFYYIDETEGMVYAINRNGEEVGALSAPGIQGYGLGILTGNRRVATVHDYSGYLPSQSLLLDENLNIIETETSGYSFINILSLRNENYLVTSRENPLSPGIYYNSLQDIIDLDGNIIISNLSYVYYLGGGYMRVESGFYAGIMHLDGTWLYKTSIFTNIEDETGYIY